MTNSAKALLHIQALEEDLRTCQSNHKRAWDIINDKDREIGNLKSELEEEKRKAAIGFIVWREANFNCDGVNDKGETIYVSMTSHFYTTEQLYQEYLLTLK